MASAKGLELKYESEDQVLKVLGIDSWRKLSRQKVIKFASMMPDMDRELAVKIIEQFPAFSRFALEALQVMERVQESALGFNERSQDKVHKAYQDVRSAIAGELKKDVTPEERERLIETMMQTADKEAAKDSENKRLIVDLVKTTAVVGSAALLAAVVVLGARAEQSEDSSLPDELV